MPFNNAETIMECTNKVTKYKVNFVDLTLLEKICKKKKKKKTPKMRVNNGVSQERRFLMKWNFIKTEQRKSAALSGGSTPPGRTWRSPR